MIFVSIVSAGAVALWVTALVYMLMALKHRKPNVSLWSSPLYRPSLLTEKGVKLLVRYYVVGAAFVAWLGLSALIGAVFF